MEVAMIQKNTVSFTMFDDMFFTSLVPKDHLLVKIQSLIDFSFVYDIVRDSYSAEKGRGSIDPVLMVKVLLLEYLYDLSDVQVVKRIQTDVAFRWFLGLTLDDKAPDDTTVSHFRVKRLKDTHFEQIFTEIVRKCIERDLVKTRRYMMDSTDVAANAAYPSDKQLLRQAFRRVVREVARFDAGLAASSEDELERAIDAAYDQDGKVTVARQYGITEEHFRKLYTRMHERLASDEGLREAFRVCRDVLDAKLVPGKGADAVISVVDPDARVAHKTPGNLKRGYKDHIIVDEDSEIILASVQTPFNVRDEHKCAELVEKVAGTLELKPQEVSADKVYGTVENRAYLLDNGMTANIGFPKEPDRENAAFGIRDFTVSDDVSSVTCPAGKTTGDCRIREAKDHKKFKTFHFPVGDCRDCPLRERCLERNKKGGIPKNRTRRLTVPFRYDAVLHDRRHCETEAFKDAYDKRSKVERRFATMVRNHGLRRCRSTGLSRAKIHITLANTACNIVRMVNLVYV
jgi:transposase